jgi:hypothetical protein
MAACAPGKESCHAWLLVRPVCCLIREPTIGYSCPAPVVVVRQDGGAQVYAAAPLLKPSWLYLARRPARLDERVLSLLPQLCLDFLIRFTACIDICISARRRRQLCDVSNRTEFAATRAALDISGTLGSVSSHSRSSRSLLLDRYEFVTIHHAK